MRDKFRKGVSLLEALIGIMIITCAAVPLFDLVSRMIAFSKTNDYHIAYALMSGEINCMYKNHKLPESEQVITVNGIPYKVSLVVTDKKSSLVSWKMFVEKGSYMVAGIQGLLYLENK